MERPILSLRSCLRLPEEEGSDGKAWEIHSSRGIRILDRGSGQEKGGSV